MKLLLLILAFGVAHSRMDAGTYYLSNNGNDTYSGTSKTTPWYSLEKLSTSIGLIKSGDSILFERGSIFIGQLSISQSDIYVGSYGSGKKPLITGSIRISKWVPHSKNIWMAKCEQCGSDPVNVLVNGKPQPLGRYPNKGYLPISAASDKQKSITDLTLSFTDHSLNQAEVVVRSSRWTLDILPVIQYKNKTFTYSGTPSYPIETGFGYFVQRHLSTLDQHGEWFYNIQTKQLFLYLDGNVKPNDLTIEISFSELGLYVVNAQNVTIDDLAFIYQRVSGGRIRNSRNIKLRNISIQYSGKNGLELLSCENLVVENSLIANSNNNGVVWHNINNGIFYRNEILRTGLHPGRGTSGNGTYIALRITGDKILSGYTRIEENTIDSTGYNGIDFRTGRTLIKNNRISNFCMIKDDGGGIYSWENKQPGNIIEDNTIARGLGSGEGTRSPDQLFASGIYIDDRSENMVIRNNRISHCATAGIFLHNAKQLTVTGNTLAANGYSISNKEKGQLYIRLDKHGKFSGNYALGLDISGNTWNASHENSHCVYLSADNIQDLRQLGRFSQNQFIGHFHHQAIAESFHQADPCAAPEEFTLADWRRVTMQETGSIFTLAASAHYTTVGRNLIGNGHMTKDIKGWRIWPEKQSLIRDGANGTEDPSLKVIISKDSDALVYHEGFTLSKNKLYRLSFSAWSTAPITLEFVPLMTQSPWHSLGDYVCFSVDSTSKSYTYYFKPKASSENARVNFKSNHTFWIAHVTLHQVLDSNQSESPF